MKIGHGSDAGSLAPLVSNGTAADAAKPATAAAQPAGGESSAKVELSNTLQTLRADAGGTFDADKVARISQQIADGTFKIDAEAIADKLIANAQEVLAKVQR